MPRRSTRLVTAAALAAAAALSQAQTTPTSGYDVIIRGGTVIDGTGLVRQGRRCCHRAADTLPAWAAWAGQRAATEIDATGLYVTPGFINIHSHATPDALPRAENMLVQGVTTEIVNADGGGDRTRSARCASRLAVNVGPYIGFNSVWAASWDRPIERPTPTTPTDAGDDPGGLDKGA